MGSTLLYHWQDGGILLHWSGSGCTFESNIAPGRCLSLHLIASGAGGPGGSRAPGPGEKVPHVPVCGGRTSACTSLIQFPFAPDHHPTSSVCPNGMCQTFPAEDLEGEGGLRSPADWMGNNDPPFIASSIVPENPF